MPDTPTRKPFAIANWKMAMTIAESLTFVHAFCSAINGAATDSPLQAVDVVLCPPYTALHAVAQALIGTPIALGAQDLCAAPGLAHTGQVSAPLLAEAGCQWVMLNHWEVRRRTGEGDDEVNRKIHAALQAGLRPILLVGEAAGERRQAEAALAARLPTLLAGCEADQVARMALVYEPEWTIGVQEPAPSDHVAAGCSHLRRWLGQTYGAGEAGTVRIIYGGSVTPAHAAQLLASPEVDGVGASRKGRDPAAFAEIVRLTATTKTPKIDQ